MFRTLHYIFVVLFSFYWVLKTSSLEDIPISVDKYLPNLTQGQQSVVILDGEADVSDSDNQPTQWPLLIYCAYLLITANIQSFCLCSDKYSNHWSQKAILIITLWGNVCQMHVLDRFYPVLLACTVIGPLFSFFCCISYYWKRGRPTYEQSLNCVA